MDFTNLNARPLPYLEDGSVEWQAQRREGIGSSDASIILGISNYGSPRSLWEEKTGRAPFIRVTPEMQRLRQFGHHLEPVTRALTAEELGVEIVKPPGALSNKQIPWLRANLDGWTGDGRIAEFKNVHQSQAHQWDGQIPDHAELQVHHSGLVLGVSEAVVAALIGGNRLSVHEINLNNAITDIVYEAEAEFWEYVEKDTPPPVDGHEKTREVLMSEWQGRAEPKQIDEMEVSQWLEQYREAAAAEKQAQQLKREAQNNLAVLMEGHNALEDNGRVLATVQGGRLNEARLAEQRPELWEEYQTTKSVFDTQRFKKDHLEVYKDFQHKSVRVTKREA